MQTQTRNFINARCQTWRVLAAGAISLALSSSVAFSAQPLTERERAFLKIVLSGDEGKAAEYAEVAGINVNAIGGQTLSAWFYDSTDLLHRSPRIQKIVFERFKQNPNPPLSEIKGIRGYCGYAPYPQNFAIDTNGTPEQKQALQDQQFAAQKLHIDAMVAGFESLRRYGLSDRNIFTAMLQSCVYSTPGPSSTYIYDNLGSKLVAAGANINASFDSSRSYGRGGRAIERAVSDQNDEVVERLLRDGAQVQFPIATACEDKVTNLYGYSLSSTRPYKPERLLKIIGLLSAAGLPANKPVTAPPGVGFTYCKHTTLYDEALNAGNLEFAKALKNAIETTKPVARAAPAAQPSIPPVSPAAPAIKLPERIGAWQIITENGRLVAAAKANTKPNNGFAALRLECVSGKLEYAPVALTLKPMTSLWLSDAGDSKELKLVNQRALGASATMLSNEIAAIEAGAKKGSNLEWGIEMTVQSWNAVGDNVVLTGFSEMRAFMRANCKS